MSFALKRRIYEALPVAAQRLVRLVPFARLAGRPYRRTVARARWFQTASAEQIRAWQSRRLGRMLAFVVDQVPAYRSLRSTVHRLAPLEALRAFEPIDKQTLQANLPAYLPRDLDRIAHYHASTGGTSGNQLDLLLDNDSHAIETGFLHRQWARVGYRPGARKATFRGVDFSHRRKGDFWQENPVYNEVQFSPFHMGEQTLDAYVEELRRVRPAYYHGYPSALDILAEYVLRNGIALPPARAALLGSEGATPAQRDRIGQGLGCRVYSWYGHSERVVLAGECEYSDAYHVIPDYGIFELLDPDSRPCRPGQSGEIVGTGLGNFSMPLVRYRTEDFATLAEGPCRCGRHWHRIRDVRGRWRQDMIVGAGGERISIAALNMHGPMFARVIRYQYFQDRPGVCVIRLMVGPDFGPDDRAAIARAYQQKVQGAVRIETEIVDEIPLTARGKLRLLDSRLSDPGASGNVPERKVG